MMTSMTAVAALLLMMLPAPARLRSIDKGLDSQMDDARRATARSAVEWEKLWRMHAGERKLPVVDFGKEIVVAVFLGSRPTAGFAVEIVDARADGAALVVHYRETRPAAGGITAQVLTSPYHIVAVPRPAGVGDVKDVTFEKIN
jgi:hypothetical protein